MTRWLTWPGLDGARDVGLLVLRVGLGAMMVGHGWPKVTGGPATWAKLGGSMRALGVDAAPAFWGACAAFAEAGGGVLLVLGLATRPAAAALAFTMLVAATDHVRDGDGFVKSSHAIEDGIAFVALVLLGGGRYALDARLRR
jgi:putative oxidoreductase